jgi:tRNA modification GTPase
MEKTLERALEADLILLVTDARDPTPPPLPSILIEKLRNTPFVIALNKADLAPDPISSFSAVDAQRIPVSALTGLGLEKLETAIIDLVDRVASDPIDSVAISARHAHALSRARESLSCAESKLRARDSLELLASDLRAALDALGEITGRIDNEEVLNRLFATFCIGK